MYTENQLFNPEKFIQCKLTCLKTCLEKWALSFCHRSRKKNAMKNKVLAMKIHTFFWDFICNIRKADLQNMNLSS